MPCPLDLWGVVVLQQRDGPYTAPNCVEPLHIAHQRGQELCGSEFIGDEDLF